jgi:hypothetical protein
MEDEEDSHLISLAKGIVAAKLFDWLTRQNLDNSLRWMQRVSRESFGSPLSSISVNGLFLISSEGRRQDNNSSEPAPSAQKLRRRII